jgi:hypothetical protein
MSLEFVRPQLATAVDHPPPRAGWIHEVKHDGYRTLLVIERRKARSYTRNDFDWTDRYPSITKAAARLGTALPSSRARSLFRMSVAYQNSKHSNQPFDVLRKGWCSASFIALPSELGRELFDRLKRLLSNQFPFPVAGLSLKDANWVRPEIKALVRYLVGSR